ncbi:hypothetical protein GCM10027436_22490 [Actinophytocola sediminis]
MSRLFGTDPELAVARRCAAAFPASYGQITPSQISRWENGVLPVPYRVIRAYEDVLGLPAGQLTTAVDVVHQVRSVRAGPPRLDRHFDPDARLAAELDALLDRCTGDAPVSGADWDGMSARVTAMPHVYLPRRLWHELATRLLAEMSVSRGRGYQHRWEALRRLQGHPVAREEIAGAVVEMIADPASQVVVDPLMLLANDRQATQLLVDEVAAPTSERTLRAALVVCELAAGAGRFGTAESAALATLAQSYLGDDGVPEPARRAAAELVATLRPDGRRRVAPAERDASRLAAVVTFTVAALAELAARGRGVALGENRMLSRLVEELMFRPEVDVRLGAAAVLAASPFGDVLADGLAAALSTATGTQLVEYADALGMIGGRRHRPVLEELLVARVPRPVAAQAAFALGNLPGRTADPILTEAVGRNARAWHTRRGEAVAEVLRCLVYAAGMQRARPVLLGVHRRPDVPAEVRAAARWWLARY